MQLFSERLGRADRQYARESGTALPRLRRRFRAMQAWRWSDGAPAQPIHRVPADEAGVVPARAEAV